jgi:hypothetical protein
MTPQQSEQSPQQHDEARVTTLETELEQVEQILAGVDGSKNRGNCIN